MSTRAPATCTICEATCGILVDTEDGRVTRVAGDPDDPLSQGYICPKAIGMQELHDDGDRLRRPLVRDLGGDFREAGWDEALDRAARGIRRARTTYGPDAVAVYQGNPTIHNVGLMTVGQIVLRSFGTKNLFSASSVDQVPHMRAAHDVFGHIGAIPVPDVTRTQHLLVVGANPLVSQGSLMTAPGMKRHLAAIRARGGKVVVVDPRRTETAHAADAHVFLRPGTDPFFFFGLLHVLFDEGLAKLGRGIDGHEALFAGREELAGLAKAFTPERVAAKTGVSAATLRALARDFAAAPSAVCYARVGTCHQEHGTIAAWLAFALNAVTGNLDREGGAMWTKPAIDVVGLARRAGIGGHGRFASRVRDLPETASELPVAVLAEEIETPGRGQIRCLVTSAGNPVLSTPNGRRLERALASLEHVVAIDGYVNETTRHAHVILPPCSPLERDHYDIALMSFAVRNFAKWVDAPLQRPKGAKDDAEIVAELGARVHLGRVGGVGARVATRVTAERLIDALLRTGPYGLGRGGLSIAKLRAHPHGIDLGPLRPRLREIVCTPTGQVELTPGAFVGEVAVLRHALDEPPPRGLVLIGRRQLRGNNSWLHNAERLVKGPAACTLLVHPEDAQARGLAAGARGRLESARGAVDVTVETTEDMMPGVVSLPHGWGHHRSGTRLQVAEAHAGVSINDLTDEQRLDRLTGNAAFSGLEVELTAAREPRDGHDANA